MFGGLVKGLDSLEASKDFQGELFEPRVVAVSTWPPKGETVFVCFFIISPAISCFSRMMAGNSSSPWKKGVRNFRTIGKLHSSTGRATRTRGSMRNQTSWKLSWPAHPKQEQCELQWVVVVIFVEKNLLHSLQRTLFSLLWDSVGRCLHKIYMPDRGIVKGVEERAKARKCKWLQQR